MAAVFISPTAPHAGDSREELERKDRLRQQDPYLGLGLSGMEMPKALRDAGYTDNGVGTPLVPPSGSSAIQVPPPSPVGDMKAPAPTLTPPAGTAPAPQSQTPQVIPPAGEPRARLPLGNFLEQARQKNPEGTKILEEVAAEINADPNRMAMHWWIENGKKFANSSPDSNKGAQGVMQVIPSTQRELDPSGKLNPRDLRDSFRLGGMYINKMDGMFGANSPASIAGYNMGPGNVQKWQHGLMPLPAETRNYLALAGQPDWYIATNRVPNRMTVPGIAAATQDGGPDAAIKYMVRSTPNYMTMEDRWKNLETLAVGAALAKGDFQGAAAARDFVLSLSHQGTNQHLMAAHQALVAGQGATAAQHLAAAHAFVPDGTAANFLSDGKNVYAERFDEQDPSKSLGRSQITPDAVMGLMVTTSDPNKYVHFVQEQQKNVAAARLAGAHAEYYGQLPGIRAAERTSKEAIAAGHDATSAANEQARAQAQGAVTQANLEGAAERTRFQQESANARAGMRGGGMSPEIGKEVDAAYGQGSPGEKDPQAPIKANIMGQLMQNGLGAIPAKKVADAMASGHIKAEASPSTGMTRIFETDEKGNVVNPNAPTAYLSTDLVAKLAQPITAVPRQVPTVAPIRVPQVSGAPGMAGGGGATGGGAPVQPQAPVAVAPGGYTTVAPPAVPGMAIPPTYAPNPFVGGNYPAGYSGYDPYADPYDDNEERGGY